MSEASIKLKLPFSTFRRLAKKHDLYAPNPTQIGKNKKLNKKGGPVPIPLSSVLIERSKYRRISLKKRLVEEGYFEYKCSICGISKWNNIPIILQLDHINGINDDNRIENLRLVCPNCHSQTDTYCGKSTKIKKNKERISDDVIIENIKISHNISEVLMKIGYSSGEPNFKKIKELMLKYDLCFIEHPKYNNVKNNVTCKKCGKKLKFKNKTELCRDCYHNSRRKVERPEYAELLVDVEKIGFVNTGKKYGVSDNSIRKWMLYYKKLYGIS